MIDGSRVGQIRPIFNKWAIQIGPTTQFRHNSQRNGVVNQSISQGQTRNFTGRRQRDRSRLLNPKSLKKENALVVSHSLSLLPLSLSLSSWTPRRRSGEFWEKVGASAKTLTLALVRLLFFLQDLRLWLLSGNLIEHGKAMFFALVFT